MRDEPEVQLHKPFPPPAPTGFMLWLSERRDAPLGRIITLGPFVSTYIMPLKNGALAAVAERPDGRVSPVAVYDAATSEWLLAEDVEAGNMGAVRFGVLAVREVERTPKGW